MRQLPNRMTTIETIHGTTFAARTGRHVLKRILAALAVATCMLDASAANQVPTVAMQSPVNGASYTAPAAVTLITSASDSDGSVAKVEFFNGAELLGTSTSAPYHFTWTGVPAGTYAVTARATDDLGGQTTTAVATVTVTSGGAQVYYVYSDQINTPKEITNSAGVKVWQGDSEPFGANPPVENPAGQGQFTYNLRFPGQYFDRETGLHYNYYRDYDPQTGRYVQSDPVGLEGGINTYGYVAGNPLSYADPTGRFIWVVPIVTGAIGGVAGAAGNYINQKFLQKKCSVDWGQVGNAGAWGAAAGAALPVGGATIGGAVGIGAAAGAGQYLTGQMIAGDSITATGTIVSATGGAIAGGIGGSFTRPGFYGWSATAMPVSAYSSIVTNQIGANAGVSNFGRGFVGGVEGNYDYMGLICPPSPPPPPPPPPCY